MAITQLDVDRMNAAILSEERQVTIGDQTIIYRSTSDLIAARDDAVRQLRAATNTGRPRITKLAYGGRGFE